jgi:hypothetical protein
MKKFTIENPKTEEDRTVRTPRSPSRFMVSGCNEAEPGYGTLKPPSAGGTTARSLGRSIWGIQSYGSR